MSQGSRLQGKVAIVTGKTVILHHSVHSIIDTNAPSFQEEAMVLAQLSLNDSAKKVLK